MKKGFTLIELLAVILILGIITLIAIPVVNNIIKEASKGALKTTVYNIMDAAQDSYSKSILLGNETLTTYACADNDCPDLDIKGNVPTGNLTIYTDMSVSASFTNGKYCAYKNGNETEVKVIEGTCAGVTVNQFASGNTENEDIANLQNQINILQTQLNELAAMTSVDYSKNEEFTGNYWIDGKPIYTKMINFGALPNNATKTLAHGITDVQNIWIDYQNSYVITGLGSNSAAYPSTTNMSLNWNFIVNTTNLLGTTAYDRTTFSGMIAVLYTKTID